MRTTSQTVAVLGRVAEDAQADRTNKPNIDNTSMAETSRTKINIHPSRQHQVSPRALIGQEGHHQVLQQPLWLG